MFPLPRPPQNNMDDAHKYVDDELGKLEKRITEQYRRAYKELFAKAQNYFKKFEKRDAAQRALLNAGKITELEYQQWRLAQMGRGKWFEDMRGSAAERLLKANQIAAEYINDRTPEIFAVCRNHTAFGLEKEYGNIGFTLYDENTVKKLIAEQADFLPAPSVNIPKDLWWNKKLITAEMTSGILQGESIGDLADRFMNITDANRTSAIRNARTFCTAAENAGRQDGYKKADQMGIKGLRKEWIATLDNRTRHSHRKLDGQIVPWDGKFESELGSIMEYPGDKREAQGEDIYNCRCSMGVVEKSGIVVEEISKTADGGELISNMNYEEWERWKNSLDPEKVKEYNKIGLANAGIDFQHTEFVPAKTIEDAEKFAKHYASGKVKYKGIDLEYANEMNRAIHDVFETFGCKDMFTNIGAGKYSDDSTIQGSYNWFVRNLFYNKSIYKSKKAFNTFLKSVEKIREEVLPNIDSLIKLYENDASSDGKRKFKYLNLLKKSGRPNVNLPDAYFSTIHELGHYLDDNLLRKEFKNSGFKLTQSFEKFAEKISTYATTNEQEYIAETFTAYWKGETDIIDPKLYNIFERLKK